MQPVVWLWNCQGGLCLHVEMLLPAGFDRARHLRGNLCSNTRRHTGFIVGITGRVGEYGAKFLHPLAQRVIEHGGGVARAVCHAHQFCRKLGPGTTPQ